MEFQSEELIDREVEIAGYLLLGYSIGQITEKTMLRRKHVEAHIHNMRQKLKAENTVILIKLLKEHPQNKEVTGSE